MNLNDINLPFSLVAAIYKSHLVESNSSIPAEHNIADDETKKSISYLGKNQKRICLLVNYNNDVYLPDNELNFLTAILQACKLNLGDVAIVNTGRHKLSFTEIQEQLSCLYLLLFGVQAENIGLKDIPFFVTTTITDCQVVYSPAAEQLNHNNPESKLLKTKLWGCLKQMFNV